MKTAAKRPRQTERANPAAEPRRGRPKDPEKRTAILRAATRLFASRGYAGSSMEAIAQAAGVSKLTLYSHFTAKDALFSEAVVQACEEHAPPAYFDPASALPLRERLRRIGLGFIDLVMEPEVISVYRMMAAQARSSDKLGRLFFTAGPQRTIDQFARLLDAAVAAGELDVEDSQAAAGHFFCLLKGVCHLQVLMACRPAPKHAERVAQVENAVTVFLRAYSPRG
ncbi:TetR/AcrR family transcriptional regulator [Flagellatimonas centrodinii]|uniref:TetR/AcrR family transcriptional regulator n=1 Tax=Flagellatimonas centrodinii TaxID=2806210 RepID=UPI001FEE3D78|nr:TetR/AcrR family transcriptional regulator [Flagellatimonas centrodinii]ULQ45530.1 TetR/AcrR family transcriptional regulator [Flagellatimonas centrodinii]